MVDASSLGVVTSPDTILGSQQGILCTYLCRCVVTIPDQSRQSIRDPSPLASGKMTIDSSHCLSTNQPNQTNLLHGAALGPTIHPFGPRAISNVSLLSPGLCLPLSFHFPNCRATGGAKCPERKGRRWGATQNEFLVRSLDHFGPRILLVTRTTGSFRDCPLLVP